MEFKIGDKVKIIENGYMNTYWGDYNELIGKILTITCSPVEGDLEHNQQVYILEHNKHSINFVEGCLKRIEITNWKQEILK